jgi:Glycosyl transferase family 2
VIKVFACFYNEAALIPFFLSHYHYVDAIHAFVSPSTDATRELLAADPRVLIDDREMPDGIDDDLKVSWLNEAINRPDPVHLWHIVVDADEFIWSPHDPTGEMVRSYLHTVPAADVALYAMMQFVYRSDTDTDLDVTSTPVVLQRRHGVPFGRKPLITRANRGLQYVPGNHNFIDRHPCSTTHEFHGAHWQNADPSFAITRRVRDRADRMSHVNRLMHHGTHHWGATTALVEEELASHRQDPVVL